MCLFARLTKRLQSYDKRSPDARSKLFKRDLLLSEDANVDKIIHTESQRQYGRNRSNSVGGHSNQLNFSKQTLGRENIAALCNNTINTALNLTQYDGGRFKAVLI